MLSTNKPRHYQFKCLFILRFWHRRHFHCLKLFETLHLPENESYPHNVYLQKCVILLFDQICDQAGWVTKYNKKAKTTLKLHLKYQCSELLRTILQKCKKKTVIEVTQSSLRQPRPVAGSIGLGRLVNWTQPPSRRVWKTKLYSATRQDHFKSQTVLGRPAGGPYILIFGHVPLPQFHIA